MKTLPATIVEVMKALRHPETGCPWDREQDHLSLKPYLIEEAYEVLDALEANDPKALKEELGDLLLQIAFHAQLAEERGLFTFQDVERGIVDKMIRRHPHVFTESPEPTHSEEVAETWEQLKAKEGKKALSGVPRHLPALLRAVRVTEKASRVGFDWKYGIEVLDKVEEEVRELRDAIASGKRKPMQAELGDTLFALANFARHMNVDAEDALRHTIDRFTSRFEWVESALEKSGARPGDASLEQLDALWEEAKRALRAEESRDD